MHALRSARPKLSLAVPAVAVTAPLKPHVPTLIIPSLSVPRSSTATSSPLTPTTRNTAFNARMATSSALAGSATLSTRGCNKKATKSVRFAEEQAVALVSPCPRDYYGEYMAMSREERRWTREWTRE